MYDSAGGELHECSNCGAKLPAPDEHGARTCSFCHAVYTPVAPPPVAPQPVSMGVGYSGMTGGPMTVTEFTPINAPPKTSGCGCAFLVIAIIAAAIGGGVYWGVQSGNFTIDAFKPAYNFQQQIVPVPGGEPSANPAFVTVAGHYDSGQSKTIYEVLRYNGKDTKPVWVSKTFTDFTSTDAIAIDNQNVYIAAKAKLFAFKLTDGTLAWQTAMSDEISPSDCQDCLASIDKRVIVKSKDGTLQAFDQEKGAAIWTRRLENAYGDLVRVGNNFVLLDGAAGKDALSVVDLTTGQDKAPINAVCQGPETSIKDTPSTSDVFMPSPAGDSLLIFYGSSPTCVQAYDPVTGAPQWSVIADRTSFDSSSVTVVDSPQGLIIGDSSGIGIIAPDHLAYRDLGTDPDLDYLPIGVAGDLVIVEAKNNRGTAKTSIIAIDIATGTLKWDNSLGAATTVDQPRPSWSTWSSNMSKDGTFTARVVGDKVYVLTVVEDGTYVNHVSVDAITVATGTPAAHTQFDAETKDLIPSFGPPLWFGTKVLSRIGDDTIQLIDTATGQRVNKV
jgi:outer membrane protein assembly factor BamB